MSEYEFDAHIIVEGFKTKRGAADEILEAMVDAGIACSLHEAGTLNGKAKDAEIERLRAALERIIEAWDGDSDSMHDDPAEIAREALRDE